MRSTIKARFGKAFSTSRAGRELMAGLLVGFAGLTGCHRFSAEAHVTAQAALTLTSSSFVNGAIPAKFTCNGAGASPQLAWSAAPAGTASFALLVTDPDAPGGTFTHWVLYDLPAGKRELAEGLPKQGQLDDGARQGRNDFDEIGYGGPCPPGAAAHHYVFTVYALDIRLNLPAGARRRQVENALKGHVLARGELVATFSSH